MTWSDVYATVTVVALVCTPALLGGWWLEHGPAVCQAWKEYRQRNADLRRVARVGGVLRIDGPTNRREAARIYTPLNPCVVCGSIDACGYDDEGRPLIHATEDDEC